MSIRWKQKCNIGNPEREVPTMAATVRAKVKVVGSHWHGVIEMSINPKV